MKDRDAELREELEAHVRMAAADRVERGQDPRDAAAAARREMGNLSQIQEATRDVWGRRWLEHAAQDVRYALRTFRRNPSFALVAVVSLTLGIGANTALFRVVNAVRLQSLPVADPSTLVEVRLVDDEGHARELSDVARRRDLSHLAGDGRAAAGVLGIVCVGRRTVQPHRRRRSPHRARVVGDRRPVSGPRAPRRGRTTARGGRRPAAAARRVRCSATRSGSAPTAATPR